jgi:sirohydrochlorin ferrochelatase
LVGHGTREAAGIAEFLAVAEQARRITPLALEPCFLELAQPTIAEGIARLAEQGVRRITVVPVLLFAAGHAKRDIPAAIAEGAAGFPHLAIRHAAPLECHKQIVALSARRFREALEQAECNSPGGAPNDARQTLLVMVGRGSSDLSATAEMHRFSRLRRELTPVGGLETCFVARQNPSLAEMLPRAAGAGYRRIVVQPHLLFKGQLLDDIRQEVQRASGCRLPPGVPASVHATMQTSVQATVQWIVTAPLGAEPELAEAILERAATADFHTDPLGIVDGGPAETSLGTTPP